MNIGVVYYSFSGNTRQACVFLKECLSDKGHSVECLDLQPVHETKAFIKQCIQAARKQTPELLECNYDLAKYEMVIFASPVWAFAVAPALNAYLQKAQNLAGKKTACFLTCGGGTGSQHALNGLEELIRKNQGQVLFSKIIKGSQTKQRKYLLEQFGTLLELC